MQKLTTISWYNNSLIIQNPLYEHLKYLSISYKKFDPFKGSSFEKQLLYSPLKNNNNLIITNHGFIDKCKKICNKNKQPYTIIDKRIPFPSPKWQCIRDLRGSQDTVLKQFLLQDRSGILEMPTRYGKSYLMINILRAFPDVLTVVAMPGTDLLKQTADKLHKMLGPNRDIKIVGGNMGKLQGSDITLVSMDSLDKIDRESVQLLLVDEVHAGVSFTRAPLFTDFKNARIYGFSATTSGRFDGTDKLIIGLFGPVLVKKTFQQAVKENMICPIRVYLIKVKVPKTKFVMHPAVYKDCLFLNEDIHLLIAKLCDKVIPKEWQSIIFIKYKYQAAALSEYIENAEIAIASNLSLSERQNLFDKMQSNKIARCIATSIYAQGLTFSDLRVLINFSGGGGNTQTIQKPGRLAEIRPNKNRGYMFDIMIDEEYDNFTEEDSRDIIIRDDKARRNVYKRLGYEIVDVDAEDILKLKLD